ncbi:MAG TPA: DNA-binding protein [Bacteroidales bacterium]|nr:DNA-binding protein [Bacteroidales bacterium]HPT04933.1 DNA-binding protein [Bacteroidales bacterium]
MTKKKPFVLRINPEVLEAVEKWAADEFRSTNGQLEWMLSQMLKSAGRYVSPKDNKPDLPSDSPEE